MSVTEAKSSPPKVLISAESSAVSAFSEEGFCEWLGRKIADCLCCRTKVNKIAPQPKAPIARLLKQVSRIAQNATSYQKSVQNVVQDYIRRSPNVLSEVGLGLGTRPDITEQVESLDLSDVNFDDTTTGQIIAVSRASKIENIGKTFPNLTELNLSACGLGQPQRGKTHIHVHEGLQAEVRVSEDPPTVVLKSIATNCTKLVSLNLSKNVITNPSLLQLAPLKSLRTLHLQSCRQVTADGVDELSKQLGDLTIYHLPPKSARQRSGHVQVQVMSLES